MPAELGAEIRALWEAEGARIADPEARIAELGFIARDAGGALVGLCTSAIDKGMYNGLSFHAMRVLVSSEHRQNLLAFDMLAHLVEHFADAWRASGQTGPVGTKVVIQTSIIQERGKVRCRRTLQFPVNKQPLTFLLSGFNAAGHPEYCAYFSDTGELEAWQAEGGDASVKLLDQAAPEALRNEVLAHLQAHSPRSVVPSSQAGFEGRVIYTLHRDGKLAAMCELIPRDVAEIGTRLLGMLVHSLDVTASDEHAVIFAREIHAQINAKADAAPFGASGLYMVYASRTGLPAVCPRTGFHLHGVDDQGKELRVRYFDERFVKVPGA